MRIRISRKTLVKIGAWALILLISPFAFEFLLLADVIGVEAALAFLFVYLKAIRDSYEQRLERVRSILLAELERPIRRLQCLKRSYALGVASSCLVLWVSGSLIFSLMFWLPYGVILTQWA